MQNSQQITQQQLQQMQMQRQLQNAGNSYNAAASQGLGQGLGGVGGQGMQYTPQQLAAAAAAASGLTGGGQGQQNVPIRAYLDQTVIPILVDGESCRECNKCFCCTPQSVRLYCIDMVHILNQMKMIFVFVSTLFYDVFSCSHFSSFQHRNVRACKRTSGKSSSVVGFIFASP